MSARLQALCCLLILAAPPGWTGERPSSSPDLVVYLKSSQSQTALTTMKTEMSLLLSPAGFRVEWRDTRSADRTVDNAALVVVELHGVCEASRPRVPDSSELGSLASTAVSDGRVLPFSSVNCDALNRLLWPALAAEAPARQEFLYGRALARLVAHELCHYIAQTRGHDRAGVAKPSFTRRDLLSDRLNLEAGTITNLSRYKIQQKPYQELLSGPSN